MHERVRHLHFVRGGAVTRLQGATVRKGIPSVTAEQSRQTREVAQGRAAPAFRPQRAVPAGLTGGLWKCCKPLNGSSIEGYFLKLSSVKMMAEYCNGA